MKLVFTTQNRENYAAHDEFIGEYRWKYKGGSTYVVQGLTPIEAADMMLDTGDHCSSGNGFVAKCYRAIESYNDYFEEYIIDIGIFGDSEDFCESWEIPYLKIMTSCGEDDELVFEQNSKLLRDDDPLAIPEKDDEDDDWYHTGTA